ncbi:hypothetical protein I3760_12G087600 [Carya illinoinensis]|uniref:Protein SPIRAL1-like 5 n=1 Tax=Carya illinoinensis TaxID=32201 RepID=A0A8T1NZ29_CARIL|nr:protein SPIRAL1-like 5 [Carya illinoinensis]KAG2677195.1 hypothetical protein I3760_12G087600 [Carya illinoinensis]KAG6634027.1 hypothetical protein CIPAW_12G090200 [Carya illinoinensis]
MSRGESYGGGQSSLGYLFGSDHPDQKPSTVCPPSKQTVNPPPYGIDTASTVDQKPPAGHSPTEKEKVSNNNYHRAQGQNSGNFITDRPSTKVKSVPGGDSSLGYLFGDK